MCVSVCPVVAFQGDGSAAGLVRVRVEPRNWEKVLWMDSVRVRPRGLGTAHSPLIVKEQPQHVARPALDIDAAWLSLSIVR